MRITKKVGTFSRGKTARRLGDSRQETENEKPVGESANENLRARKDTRLRCRRGWRSKGLGRKGKRTTEGRVHAQRAVKRAAAFGKLAGRSL